MGARWREARGAPSEQTCRRIRDGVFGIFHGGVTDMECLGYIDYPRTGADHVQKPKTTTTGHSWDHLLAVLWASHLLTNWPITQQSDIQQFSSHVGGEIDSITWVYHGLSYCKIRAHPG